MTKFHKWLLVGLAIAALITAVIFGAAYSLGKNANQKQIAAITARAEQGDQQAQFYLGYLYKVGVTDALPADANQALHWYGKAAAGGLPQAQHLLGQYYYSKQDYAQAAQWFTKAAQQNYAAAQNNLGLLYYEGQGVKQDYATAAQWYQKAADQGVGDAQISTAVMYYNGQGVKKDKEKAYLWFYLGYMQATPEYRAATQQAGQIYNALEKSLSPAKIKALRQQADALRTQLVQKTPN